MAFAVLPILDATTGRLQFRLHGEWRCFSICESRRLQAALQNAVSRPIFNPESQELIVSVASTGRREGKPLAFSLAKFPAPRALAKLGG